MAQRRSRRRLEALCAVGSRYGAAVQVTADVTVTPAPLVMLALRPITSGTRPPLSIV